MDTPEENLQNMSKVRIVFSIVVVIAIAFVAYTYKDGKKENIIVEEKPSINEVWPSTEVDKKEIKEKTKVYDIDVVYPVVKDSGISANIKSFVEEQISGFKSDTEWANDPELAGAQSNALSISIDYKSTRSQKTETYIFDIATYTGGAHGMPYTHTVTFSSTGDTLALDKIFKNTGSALGAISMYAKAELKNLGEYYVESFVEDGTAPRLENYQNFVVTDSGITFIFDPYQVAPYAAGIQRVEVPLSVFKDFVKPDIF